jgi:hypothetical protein
MNPPSYLSYYILLSITHATAVMLFGLNKALGNAGWPRTERRSAVGLFSSVLIGWYLAAWIHARSATRRKDWLKTSSGVL